MTHLSKILLFLVLALILRPGASFASEETLKVLTYNAGLLSYPLSGDITPLVQARSKLLPQVIARVAHERQLDILALDGVWEPAVGDALEAALSREYQVIFPSPHEKFLFGLSKYGFLDQGNRELWSTGLFLAVRSPYKVDPSAQQPVELTRFRNQESMDRGGQGILSVQLIGPNQVPFLFLLAQLDDPFATQYDKNAASIVDSQVSQLGEVAKQRSSYPSSQSPHLPILVCGDMSLGPGHADSEYDRFQKDFGWKDAFEAVHPGSFLKSYTWDKRNSLVYYNKEYADGAPQALIDHCFTQDSKRHGWEPQRARITLKGRYWTPAMRFHQEPSPLSDHYGLQVQLKLR